MEFTQKLKTLLEGKTVVSVSESNHPESLVEITTNSGSFRIYANDLGAWVAELPGKEGYSDIGLMFEEYLSSVYHEPQRTAEVTIQDNCLTLRNPSGAVTLKANLDQVDPEDRKLLLSIDPELLPETVNCGSMWRCGFI